MHFPLFLTPRLPITRSHSQKTPRILVSHPALALHLEQASRRVLYSQCKIPHQHTSTIGERTKRFNFTPFFSACVKPRLLMCCSSAHPPPSTCACVACFSLHLPPPLLQLLVFFCNPLNIDALGFHLKPMRPTPPPPLLWLHLHLTKCSTYSRTNC